MWTSTTSNQSIRSMTMENLFEKVFDVPTLEEFNKYIDITRENRVVIKTNDFFADFFSTRLHEMYKNLISAILHDVCTFHKQQKYLKYVGAYIETTVKELHQQVRILRCSSDDHDFYCALMTSMKTDYAFVINDAALYEDFKRWYKENKTKEGN